jgi:hypothetical protein
MKVTYRLICILFLMAFAMVLYQCGSHTEAGVDAETPSLYSELLASDVSYVGSESCRPCHIDKFDGFKQTGMGKSFAVAHPDFSSSFAHGPGYVYDTISDLHYRAYWEDSLLKVTEFRLFKGDTIHQRTEVISYIIGSGHHTNSHIIQRKGQLFQAPVTFYTQSGWWDLAPGFEAFNSRFTRRLEAECITCHNAYPRQKEQSFNAYDDIPHGISCERCHGPGERHVSRMLSGQFYAHTKEHGDSHIINPRRLPWERQIDVCQRCHLQGNNVLKPGKTFYDFKPGMELNAIFTVFMPEYEAGHAFHMASHAERFQMSKCFTVSHRQTDLSSGEPMAFTCIHCHDPHKSVKITGVSTFNQTCKNCHATPPKDCQNTTASGSNCVSCHMPVSHSEDIPHVTVHDHYIRKPESTPEVKGKLKGLKAVNENNPDDLTLFLAYISYYEKYEQNPLYMKKASEYLNKMGKSTYEQQALIYYYFTLNQYREVVKLSSGLSLNTIEDAWSAYRIGRSHEQIGKLKEALEWFDRCCALKPSYPPFLNARIAVLLNMKKVKQAAHEMEQVIQLDPKDEEVYGLKARLFLYEGHSREASMTARKALGLNPDDPNALFVLEQLSASFGTTFRELEYHQTRKKKR